MGSLLLSAVIGIIFILSSWTVEGKLKYIKTSVGQNSYLRIEQLQTQGKIASSSKPGFNNNREKRSRGVPVATTPFSLDGDSHRYASVHYFGENSNVREYVT